MHWLLEFLRPKSQAPDAAQAVDAERLLESLSNPVAPRERDVSFFDTDWMSPTWQRLRAHIEQRIAILRMQNDDPTKDAAQTAALRGQIKELKSLLRLPESAPAKPADDA